MPTSETSNPSSSTDGAAGAAVDTQSSSAGRGPDRDRKHELRRPLGLGILLLCAGIPLMAVGASLGTLQVWARTVVFLGGLALTFAGLGRLGRGVFGERFDLTYWLSVGWLVLLIGLAAAAPLIPFAEHADVAATLDQPVFAQPNLLSPHPLGTNNFGLDLLARSIYGARTSLLIALTAVTIGTLVGAAVGILAGYFRRSVDRIVGVITNSLLAVPPLILLIALAAVLPTNLRNVAFALSLLTIPGMIRLARANTMAFAQREFVLAAKAMGASRWRVMVRELLPNVVLPVLSMAMVLISMLIVAEASLSFLGLGIQPPEPTWGNMIAEGEGDTFQQHPHIVLVPGLFLFLTVFSLNVLGEKARKRWDPRSGKL